MFKKIKFVVPTLLLALSFAAIPVYAHSGGDDSNTDPSRRGSGITDSKVEAEELHPEVEVETHTTDSQEVETHNAKHASRLIEAEMQLPGAKKHSAADREKNCKKHQKGLETKLANLGKNADKHKAHIDGVLAKALAFKTDKNLNPDGFTALVTTAQTTQASAAASITALKALTVNIDCTSPNVATNVATFKAASAQVRSDLFAYRDAVKAALISLENVAPQGSDQ